MKGKSERENSEKVKGKKVKKWKEKKWKWTVNSESGKVNQSAAKCKWKSESDKVEVIKWKGKVESEKVKVEKWKGESQQQDQWKNIMFHREQFFCHFGFHLQLVLKGELMFELSHMNSHHAEPDHISLDKSFLISASNSNMFLDES